MVKIHPGVFTALILFISSSTQAQPAKPAGIIEYSGKCLKIDGNNEKDCTLSIKNIRYLDGYDSFQFEDQDNKKSRNTVSFVGTGWRPFKLTVEDRPSDTRIFMPLEQVLFADLNKGQINKKSYRGQCILEFKAKSVRSFSDIKLIWCEYSEGSTGHVLALTEITKSNVVVMTNFLEY